MQVQEIAAALQGRPKGGLYTLIVERPAKVRKTAGEVNIRKRSRTTAQLCDYANRAPVRDAVEAGERDAPVLPGYIESSFMEGNVRFWTGNNGKVYLPVVVAKSHKAEWFRDGLPVELDSIAEFLLASETAEKTDKDELESKGQVQFFAVGVENVSEIH